MSNLALQMVEDETSGNIEVLETMLDALFREQGKEVSESQLSSLPAITRLAEVKDEDTGKHIERTQIFCRLLASELRDEALYDKIITDDYIRDIYHAAALHDVGKVGIPDDILLKKGRLEPDEFEVIKTHVEIGKHALREALSKYKQNPLIKLGLALTASHHERWDGTGYPDGLYGQDIPLSGRIMALVDVYDALRSKRPYKEPLSHEESVHIIKEGGGLHFDPSIVKAFSRIEAQFKEIYEKMKEDGSN